MYLSKVNADRKRWDVVHDIEDRDLLHKKILKFFMSDLSMGEHEDVRKNLGVLFRVEQSAILIQSKVAPNQDRKLPGYVFVGSKNIEEAYRSILEGRLFRFRLDANTSMQVPVGNNDLEWVPEDSNVQTRVKLHRVGCGSYPERAKWFERVAEKCGFSPERYTMDTFAMVKAAKACFEATRFEGEIKVRDRIQFLKCLQDGVGQGKSYGLGMLSIRNA